MRYDTAMQSPDALSLLLIVSGALGLTWAAMTTPLLRRPRAAMPWLDTLLSCPLCSGFHAGWLCCIFYWASPWLLVPFVASAVCGLVLSNRV